MRNTADLVYVAICLMLPFAIKPAAAGEVPACNTQLIKRNGNEITVGLQQLRDEFNQKLSGSGSNFSDLQLTTLGHNELKVSGKKGGKTISISGPLRPAKGVIALHASKIMRDGKSEKGLMDLVGADLADYAHFNKTPSLSAKGDDLFIHPDPLLNTSGKVIGLSLNQSRIILKFASRPCR